MGVRVDGGWVGSTALLGLNGRQRGSKLLSRSVTHHHFAELKLVEDVESNPQTL